MHEEYVPVIGTAHLHSIAALLDRLFALPSHAINDVQASNTHNGYAVGAIALAAFLLESAIARLQYLRHVVPPRGALTYLREVVGASVADDAEEVFVVRDIIAHNHLWDARIRYDASGAMQLESATLRAGYGDAKFRRCVDQTVRMTRRLTLNSFPTRISVSDVGIVLRVVATCLQALDALDARVMQFARQPVRFQGRVVLARDLFFDVDGEIGVG
jgi:hypothetical protein